MPAVVVLRSRDQSIRAGHPRIHSRGGWQAAARRTGNVFTVGQARRRLRAKARQLYHQAWHQISHHPQWPQQASELPTYLCSCWHASRR